MDQKIFNSINKLTLHQFVQNKFVQKFVTISFLKNKRVAKAQIYFLIILSSLRFEYKQPVK